MVIIAFHTPQIDVRGSCVALFDYALYHEKLLNGKSLIIVPKNSKNDPLAIRKYTNRFPVIFYKDKDHMERILTQFNCDILYCIKYGLNDGIYSQNIPTCIHCVFDMSESHGTVYAAVSSAVAEKYNKQLFVPHMIGLRPSNKENMREELGIGAHDIVLGRLGGLDTFDLEFAREVIKRVVNERKDVYFLLGNTPEFYKHNQIIHFDKIITDNDKNRFIATCDAHIEFGSLGHSFGLNIAEYSVNNKPLIIYNGKVWNRAHIDIIKDKGLYFENEKELYIILTTFNKKDYEGKDLNCYKDYSPKKVMEIFKKVFIDPCIKHIPT